MPEVVTFYLLAGLAVVASALVIGQRNPMYSVLLLIVSFAALAGLYIQLDAPFVAVAQIIIYAGAIMVLFLFVVMLLNAPQEDAAEWDRTHPLRRPGIARFGAALAGVLILQLAYALMRVNELEALLLRETTTIGVRRSVVRRRALARDQRTVRVLGFDIAVKVVELPDGTRRAKPEFEDVQRVAEATGRAARDIFLLASMEAERP